MRTAWTGGQYSLLRAAFGAAVAVAAACSPGLVWLRAVTALAAVLFAAGIAAPIAALGALAGWIALADPRTILQEPWTALVPLALGVHALAPRAPFGSVAALGRLDPGGGWRLPRGCAWLAWTGVLALALASAVSEGTADIAGALRIAALVGGLFPPLRPYAWLVLVGGETYASLGAPLALPARVLALGILFDPGWVRGTGDAVERVYYDGSCGLCHRAVRFLLAEDVDGSRFRFAPLHGEAFEAHVPPAQRTDLPDSVVVQLGDGRLLVRSDAALHVLGRLGGIWRAIGLAGRAVPRPLRDAAYDGVARVRKRLFAAPQEACPLLPRELRDRFEPRASSVRPGP